LITLRGEAVINLWLLNIMVQEQAQHMLNDKTNART
jgi:hypothetical protein